MSFYGVGEIEQSFLSIVVDSHQDFLFNDPTFTIYEAKIMADKLPIKYPLAPNVRHPNGTIFVELCTLDKLRAFWDKHKSDEYYQYSGTGVSLTTGQWFLEDCEWVFGPTKEAVIETIFRWNQLGIEAKFDDLRQSDPNLLESLRAEDKVYKNEKIESGRWTLEDEINYLNFMEYVGDWELCNLPNKSSSYDLLNGRKVQDKDASPDFVAKEFKKMFFEEFSSKYGGEWCVETMTASELEDYIKYWEAERTAGEDSYGRKNENTLHNDNYQFNPVFKSYEDMRKEEAALVSLELVASKFCPDDYHKVIKPILLKMVGHMAEGAPEELQTSWAWDTVFEKIHGILENKKATKN